MADTQETQSAKIVGEWFENMPFTSTHWKCCITLFIAFIIEAWEMMILIFSSGAIAAEFNLSGAQVGSLISALFLGMIPGALLWGRLMGKIGRKKCMMFSIGIYGLFPILSAFAPSYEFLWAVRFICGVVLSGALVTTFPYFEELVPVKSRGRATVFLSSGWPFGVLIALGLTALLGEHGWRLTLGVSVIASLWTLVIWRVLPESPYWLAQIGRTRDASSSLNQLAEGKMGDITVLENPESTASTTSFTQLFQGKLLKVTGLQLLINFCFSWGYWGMATWMPGLLAKRGLSTPEGLGFIALSTLFMFPGYIAASYITARIGRKKTMLIFVFVSAIAGFGFAYSQTINQMYLWNFVLSFFSLGAWGVWNTWLGEIYTTSARGHGQAWGVSAQRVANAVAPIVIGAMMVRTSFNGTVAFITCFLAITFVAAIFLKETEGEILS